MLAGLSSLLPLALWMCCGTMPPPEVTLASSVNERRVKAEPMSYARFSTDDRTGAIRGYLGQGRFTNDPLETFGNAITWRMSGSPAISARKRSRPSANPPCGGAPI